MGLVLGDFCPYNSWTPYHINEYEYEPGKGGDFLKDETTGKLYHNNMMKSPRVLIAEEMFFPSRLRYAIAVIFERTAFTLSLARLWGDTERNRGFEQDILDKWKFLTFRMGHYEKLKARDSYPFTARVFDLSKDLLRIFTEVPFLLISQVILVYGLFRPYDAIKIFTSLDFLQHGNDLFTNKVFLDNSFLQKDKTIEVLTEQKRFEIQKNEAKNQKRDAIYILMEEADKYHFATVFEKHLLMKNESCLQQNLEKEIIQSCMRIFKKKNFFGEKIKENLGEKIIELLKTQIDKIEKLEETYCIGIKINETDLIHKITAKIINKIGQSQENQAKASCLFKSSPFQGSMEIYVQEACSEWNLFIEGQETFKTKEAIAPVCNEQYSHLKQLYKNKNILNMSPELGDKLLKTKKIAKPVWREILRNRYPI